MCGWNSIKLHINKFGTDTVIIGAKYEAHKYVKGKNIFQNFVYSQFTKF